jgi:NADP-dependent 3-hydroxy acid dehydrogenase YdfG
MTDMAFLGRRALVTGAGRGIGRAVAIALAAQGANVMCISRTQEELNETVALAGDRAMAMPCDISLEDACSRIRAALEASGEGLDFLVHSAGIMKTGVIDQVDLEDLDALYRINVRSPYALTQAVLPMLKVARGEIVFINSSIIRAANIQGRSLFAATQAALKALADGIRDEVNADGVRVMSVMPGTTATPRQEALAASAGKTYQPERLLQAEDVAQSVTAALQLSRTAELTDLYVRPMQKS